MILKSINFLEKSNSLKYNAQRKRPLHGEK
jgi:hypothetical protein